MVNKPVFFSCQIGTPGVYSKFCNNNSYGRIDKTIESVINYINNNKQLIGISIYGSELNNPKVSELLETCKKQNLQVALDLSCNSDDINFFNQNKSLINVVRVFLFSLESDKHNSMFYDNDYEKVLSFIDSLQSQNIGKVVVVPITDNNYSELIPLSSWIYSKGFKTNPIPIPKCCSDKVKVLRKESFEIFLQNLQILQHDLGEELYLDTPIGYEKFYKPCLCPAFRLSFDLHNGFGIRPCKFSKNILGEIENINLNWATCKSLWQKSKQCLRCLDFEKCGGGCICNKNIIDEKDFYCKKKEEDFFVNV